MINFDKIDKNWTLFLDRDGVINHEKNNDYIRNRDEFIFYDGVLDALKIINTFFGIIVIVTNQKGVGKELMTLDDLTSIHEYMMQQIIEAGGRVDKIYFCTDMDNESLNRKPQPGMALQAKNDFPTIDFSKSLMVGNKLSDMRFGRNAGLSTIFVATTHPETPFPDPLIDARFNNLPEFAKALSK